MAPARADAARTRGPLDLYLGRTEAQSRSLCIKMATDVLSSRTRGDQSVVSKSIGQIHGQCYRVYGNVYSCKTSSVYVGCLDNRSSEGTLQLARIESVWACWARDTMVAISKRFKVHRYGSEDLISSMGFEPRRIA